MSNPSAPPARSPPLEREAPGGAHGAARDVAALHWQQARGDVVALTDQVAQETAVALVYNGVSHVVMMVSPADLEDFALGFSLSEGILETPAQLYDVECSETDGGIEIALTISSERFALLKDQRRNLTGRTGCGLCGAESLAQAVRPPTPVTHSVKITQQAIQRAVATLGDNQPLQTLTGAVHGAAWCNRDGDIVLLREDVGRHNALDKLIGALSRQGVGGDRKWSPAEGFALISSRASYEMVTKAGRMGIEVLVAVSAPTTLAIEFATAAGLTLVGFARPGRHMLYTSTERVIAGS